MLGRLCQEEARKDVFVVGALLTVAVFVVDVFVPLGIASGVLYIAPVFLSMWLPDRRLIVAVASLCSLLTLTGFWLSPAGVEPSIALTNRALAIAGIWTVAALSLQRRSTEGALARSEATHRAVLATTADGILTLDGQGRILSANPAAEQMFGASTLPLVGRPFTDVLAPEHHERFAQLWAPVQEPVGRDRAPSGPESPAPPAHEATGLRAGRFAFPLEVVLVPLLHAVGPRCTVTVRDITERRMLEQHLLRVSDAERRTLGHDLHEGLGQSLTGLSLISQHVARRLEALHLDEAREVSELATLLHHVDEEAKSLYRSYAPLDGKGRFGDAVAELVTSVVQRHAVAVHVSPSLGALEGPADRFCAAQLHQLLRDLLHAALGSGQAEQVAVDAGRRGDACWVRLRLVGADGGEPWSARVRPLAYRARLVAVHLDLSEEDGTAATVVCRWSSAQPASATRQHLASRSPVRAI